MRETDTITRAKSRSIVSKLQIFTKMVIWHLPTWSPWRLIDLEVLNFCRETQWKKSKTNIQNSKLVTSKLMSCQRHWSFQELNFCKLLRFCMVNKVFIQKRSYTWSGLIKTKYLWDLQQKIVWQLNNDRKSLKLHYGCLKKSSKYSSGHKARPGVGAFLHINLNDHALLALVIFVSFSSQRKSERMKRNF